MNYDYHTKYNNLYKVFVMKSLGSKGKEIPSDIVDNIITLGLRRKEFTEDDLARVEGYLKYMKKTTLKEYLSSRGVLLKDFENKMIKSLSLTEYGSRRYGQLLEADVYSILSGKFILNKSQINIISAMSKDQIFRKAWNIMNFSEI